VVSNTQIEVLESLIWDALGRVQDPEIPVLSLVDLGMISSIKISKELIEVYFMPTFTGCPAIDMMQKMIIEEVERTTAIKTAVIIDRVHAWNSDMISEAGKKKLVKFGIAAPNIKAGCGVTMLDLQSVDCPFCESNDTVLRSPFGSTLCRAMHYCNHCKQSFEQFKPVSH